MCPVWLLMAVVVGGARGAVNQCWEHPSCHELKSDSSMMECIQLCRPQLAALPVVAHLQAPPPLGPSSSSHQPKRPYFMEHFRWGKPVGQKRRPVVYTSNGMEEESAEAFPGKMRRRRKEEELLGGFQDKTRGFHLGGKRYGGFMKSWDEQSQRPLLTLFRNVINKNAPQPK
ncbi:pro-opiomelanocortin-like [Centropristis striata]|uniref:pro-opiomelanocortin-like n=1 Tax=Centropristis striata TaxID=184440 RepID=UPI0027E0D745|nr:pro-opiomelanocortin-like [Centropristis striata]